MTGLASTPYTAAGLILGGLLLAAGLVLLVSRLRPVWRHLRLWTVGPRVDRVLRAAGWLLPGTGLVVLVGADPDVALAGRDVALAGVLAAGVAAAMVATYALARSLTLRWLARRDETPARADLPARGPVASPLLGVDGDATVVLPAVSQPPQVRGGYRAGHATAPRGDGRPTYVRLTGAHWGESAPRRAGAAERTRDRSAAHQAPTRPGPRAAGAHRAGPEAGWDQTVLLAPVGEQQTETWTRVGADTPTR